MTDNNKIQANSIDDNTIQANLTEQDLWIGSVMQQNVYLHWQDVKDICTKEVSKAYEQAKEENAKLKELLKECVEVLKMVAGETIDFPHTVDECIDKINQALGEDK